MPKGKRNKDPGAKSKRKVQRFKENMLKTPPIRHQFTPGKLYNSPDSSGGKVYYKADKGGSLRRINPPNQGRAQ